MTAPGDKKTIRRYGLIGHPLGHSLSPFIHERIMDAVGLKGTYELFDVRPSDLRQMLPRILRHLDGFNCTIPHKETILPFLNGLDRTAEEYQAVNTVYRGTGYNTDAAGFRACGIPLAGRRVLLLGAGGVSRMMGLEAAKDGAASIRILARGVEKARRLADDIIHKTGVDAGAIDLPVQAGTPDTILNGTPLGMWPLVRGLPIPDSMAQEADVLFDSVYNPAATRLLLKGSTPGSLVRGGMPMLFGQAVAAQRIWNPQIPWDQPDIQEKLARVPALLAREQIHKHPVKYVFTGFMGSGKSATGRTVADILNVPYVDLDDRIQQKAGKSIPAIFEQDGETAFRIIEADMLRTVLTEPGTSVIATGGGALVQPDAMMTVEQTQSLIIFLDTRLETIRTRIGSRSGRPLLDSTSAQQAKALYERRRPEYRRRADLIVDNSGTESVQEIAERIISLLGYGT